MDEISERIIELAQQGDRRSFEMIYEAYFSFASHVAYRIVSNREDAEEVVQETFLNIYRNLVRFEFRSSLKTWIYRITINTALNFVKKHAKHRRQTPYIESFSGAQEPDAVKLMETAEEEGRIQQLLSALSPDHRAVTVLRSVQGLSYQEIAETLAIPINTVRSRIKRAREALLALRKEVIKDEV
jgi:RNA polymerase sigma-70 factor (ECF subfamily)